MVTNKLIYLVLLLMCLSEITAAQQKSFAITGTIQGKKDGYMYLGYPVDSSGTYKKDSSVIRNGQFSFTGNMYDPAAHATLSLYRTGGNNNKTTDFFLVPGNLHISLDYQDFSGSMTVKGSPVQAQADSLEKSKALINAQTRLINDAYLKAFALYKEAVKTENDEAVINSLKEAADLMKESIDPLKKQARVIDRAFMDQFPTSFVTAYILRWHLPYMTVKEGLDRYSRLPEVIKHTSLGKIIKAELDDYAQGAPGMPAFPFVSMELRGGELKLSDYRGTYVLLDFWASWCVPCRKGNPHLLSLYAKYKDKGLEIIGISDDDRNPEAWKKAIEKDGIGVWKQVLRGLKRTADGKSDRSTSISDQYGIVSLPTKILIDPNGMIIGRYGEDGESNEALDRKLAELFDK